MLWKNEISCKLWDVVWLTTVGMMHAVHNRMGGGGLAYLDQLFRTQ